MDIRTLCLGALTLKESTGYEIKKLCQEGAMSHFLEASYGSIYPALNKLHEEGLVTCRTETQDKRPDRKVYSVTEAGAEAFAEALRRDPLEDKYRSDFLFISLFAHLLPKGHMEALINEQIDRLRCQADHLAEAMKETQSGGAQFVSGFGRASVEAIIKYLDQNRDLLEQSAEEATPPIEESTRSEVREREDA